MEGKHKRHYFSVDDEEVTYQPKKKNIKEESDSEDLSAEEVSGNENSEDSEFDDKEDDKESKEEYMSPNECCHQRKEKSSRNLLLELKKEEDYESEDDGDNIEIKQESNEDNVSVNENEASDDETLKDSENEDLYEENNESGEDIKSEEDYSEVENVLYGDHEDNENDAVINLDRDQVKVVKYVQKLLTDNTFYEINPTIILVEGPAGTGKTEVLKAMQDCDDETIFVASSGVVALNYEGGRTAHSMFGFPFTYISKNTCNINDFDQQVSRAPIIVYDAVNMTDARLLEMLNTSLQDLMGNSEPFGGKIMVFGADFMELVPLVPGVPDPNLFSVKLSSFLKKYDTKTFSLRNSYRFRSHYEFLSMLGCGVLPSIKHEKRIDIKYVPLEGMLYSTDICDIIEFVYPSEILSIPDLCAKRAILAPTLKKVIEINETISEIVVKKTVKIPSTDVIKNYEIFDTYMEQMDMLHEEDVFPESDLVLWEGALCMVTQNMYQTMRGYFQTLLNGSKVIIVDIKPELVIVRRPGKNERIPVERKIFRGMRNGERFTRKQFPLRLAYATTIHKSQGQTLEKVGVDLREPVFCHGQLYLALSRVRRNEDLKVCTKKVFHGVPYASNIVDQRLVNPTFI